MQRSTGKSREIAGTRSHVEKVSEPGGSSSQTLWIDECGSGGLNTHLAGRTLAASAVVRCGGSAAGNVCREMAEEELQAVSATAFQRALLQKEAEKWAGVDRLMSQPFPGVRSQALPVLTSLSLSFLICKMGKSYGCVRIEWLTCLKH